MEDNMIMMKYILMKNAISLICFTVLAIVFNRWWLVFLSFLFMSSYNYSIEEE